jgi:hypothetical protein
VQRCAQFGDFHVGSEQAFLQRKFVSFNPLYLQKPLVVQVSLTLQQAEKPSDEPPLQAT